MLKKPLQVELESLMPRFDELARGFPQVVAAYLFGSHTSGRPTSLSDIDVGILLIEGLPDMESFRIEMSLTGELEKIFNTINIDLVVLNKAPLPIQYNATCGKLLFCTDHDKSIDFEVYVRKYYIDCLPIYREYREEFFKRIKEGRAPGGQLSKD